MKMIRERIDTPVKLAFDFDWNNDALEAQAFGSLAVRSLRGFPLSMPGTTCVPYPLIVGRISRY